MNDDPVTRWRAEARRNARRREIATWAVTLGIGFAVIGVAFALWAVISVAILYLS